MTQKKVNLLHSEVLLTIADIEGKLPLVCFGSVSGVEVIGRSTRDLSGSERSLFFWLRKVEPMVKRIAIFAGQRKLTNIERLMLDDVRHTLDCR